MGNACRAPDPEERRMAERNRRIEEELAKQRRKEENEVKILLLGAGESGKSTIAKQMRFLFLKGFTEKEKKTFRKQIHYNIITAIQLLLKQCQARGLELQHENHDSMMEILDITFLEPLQFTDEVAHKIEALWNDSAVQQVLKWKSEFMLSDSTEYFMGNVMKYSNPTYMPDNEDILRVRAKTTGVVETKFVIQRTVFRMVDVGGQRTERKKWIHCFQDVTAIIYCAALSEYDMKLEELPDKNRMHESVELFGKTINNKYFQNTPIILFLNKKDLFEKKIEAGVDLQCCYPQYSKGFDKADAMEYIRKKYLERDQVNGRDIFTHFTVATDTRNVEIVFNAVRSILMNETLDNVLI